MDAELIKNLSDLKEKFSKNIHLTQKINGIIFLVEKIKEQDRVFAEASSRKIPTIAKSVM